MNALIHRDYLELGSGFKKISAMTYRQKCRQKMPIKTEQQLEKMLQYLSEQSECSCRDICMLLDVEERRARQLLQELQEQKGCS